MEIAHTKYTYSTAMSRQQKAEYIKITTTTIDFLAVEVASHMQAEHPFFNTHRFFLHENLFGFFCNAQPENYTHLPLCCFRILMEKKGILFPRWQIIKLFMKYYPSKDEEDEEDKETIVCLRSSHGPFWNFWSNGKDESFEYVDSLSQEDCVAHIVNFLHKYLLAVIPEHGLK